MATSSDDRKRKAVSAPEHREGRKVFRSRGELCCPICEVTLWPGTLEQHYQQELAKLGNTTPSLSHSKKRRASWRSTGSGVKENSKEKRLFQRAQNVLERVKRRQILFSQHADASSTQDSASTSTHACPVCNCPLPSDEGVAQTHVTECLRRAGEGDGGSSDSEEYEEYTWCNVTRVRATSMLSPQARANMFDGTVISKGESSLNEEEVVNVEDDETTTYGPAQFVEEDVHVMEESEGETEDSEVAGDSSGEELDKESIPQQPQCLICMDSYRKPLVSVKCWHVYCEKCWLKALGTKKLCPKCKDITSASDLRKLFL